MEPPPLGSPAGSQLGMDSLETNLFKLIDELRVAASPQNARKSPAPLSGGAAETADSIDTYLRPSLEEPPPSPQSLETIKAVSIPQEMDLETVRSSLVDVTMAVNQCINHINEARNNLTIELQKDLPFEKFKNELNLKFLKFIASTKLEIRDLDSKYHLLQMQLEIIREKELLNVQFEDPSATPSELDHLKTQLEGAKESKNGVKHAISLATHEIMRLNILRFVTYNLKSLQYDLSNLNQGLTVALKELSLVNSETLVGFKAKLGKCRKIIEEELLNVSESNNPLREKFEPGFLYHFFDLNIGTVYCTSVEEDPKNRPPTVAQRFKEMWFEVVVQYYKNETLLICVTNEHEISHSYIKLKSEHLQLSGQVRQVRGHFCAQRDVNAAHEKKALTKQDKGLVELAHQKNVGELEESNLLHQNDFRNIVGKWIALSIQHKEKSTALKATRNLALLPHEWFQITNYLPPEICTLTQEKLEICKIERSTRFRAQLRGWEELIKDFENFPLLSTAMSIDWGTTAVKHGYFYKLWYYTYVSRVVGYGELEKEVYSALAAVRGFVAHNPNQKTAWEKFLGSYQLLAIAAIDVTPEEKREFEKDAQLQSETQI